MIRELLLIDILKKNYEEFKSDLSLLFLFISYNFYPNDEFEMKRRVD